MGLLSGLKAFFMGDGSSNDVVTTLPSETYNGFEIVPMPQPENGQYRLNGVIRKDGKEHQFIRADMFMSAEECAEEVKRKARVLIDQMGDRLFG